MDLLQPYLTYIYAALGLLAALLVLFLISKAIGGSVRGRRGSRLGISEFYEIDKTRRVVLIRRDDMEHLVLIGGDHDVVIETGISLPMMAELPPQRQAPRAPVFGGRRPMLRPVEVPHDDRDN